MNHVSQHRAPSLSEFWDVVGSEEEGGLFSLTHEAFRRGAREHGLLAGVFALEDAEEEGDVVCALQFTGDIHLSMCHQLPMSRGLASLASMNHLGCLGGKETQVKLLCQLQCSQNKPLEPDLQLAMLACLPLLLARLRHHHRLSTTQAGQNALIDV